MFNIFEFPVQSLILDLGCGTGDLWLENKERLGKRWKFILSDHSQEMVLNSRRNLSQFKDTFFYGVWDARSIPFTDNLFEVVVGIGLLDEVPQREPVLDEIWRVVKPGGKFYATAGGLSHLQELETLIHEVLPEADLGGNPERFGLENGERILSKWFSNISRYRYPDKLVFYETIPILHYILSEAAIRERLTREKTTVLTRLIDELLGQQGSISVTSDKGMFQAVKKIV